MSDWEWHCICGSGDDGEWHTAACAISNTPDDVWHGTGDADAGDARTTHAENEKSPHPAG